MTVSSRYSTLMHFHIIVNLMQQAFKLCISYVFIIDLC